MGAFSSSSSLLPAATEEEKAQEGVSWMQNVHEAWRLLQWPVWDLFLGIVFEVVYLVLQGECERNGELAEGNGQDEEEDVRRTGR